MCHHERPEAAFLRRVRQHGVEQLTAGRRPASSDDGRSKSSADSQLARAGLPTNPKPALAAARGSSVFSGARGRALDECLPCFFHAAFSFTSSQGRHRHRSVCGDTEAVAAASRRIRAALRRGARILIAYSVHAAAQVKAINRQHIAACQETGAGAKQSVRKVAVAAH